MRIWERGEGHQRGSGRGKRREGSGGFLGDMWGWPCSRTRCEEEPGKGRKQRSSPWAPATLGPQNRATKTTGSSPQVSTISGAALDEWGAGSSGSRAGQGLGVLTGLESWILPRLGGRPDPCPRVR